MKLRMLAFLVLMLIPLAGCQRGREEVTWVNPTCEIVMETGDVIRLELYPEFAPNTVANFVVLAKSGYYDGLTFHRVIPGFLIQGGDPAGNGSGGPGYTIQGEFTANGFDQTALKFTRGVVGMARRGNDYNSAGSQFFIMHADSPGLDGGYAAFGRVADEESLAVVDKIATTQVDARDKPLTEWRIRSVTVDDKGHAYEVEIIKQDE